MNENYDIKKAPPRPNAQPPAAADKQPNVAEKFNLPAKMLETGPVLAILGIALFVGAMLGWALFSGGSTECPPPGLSGIVHNPEINTPLNRCGTVGRNYDCVYYFVNPYRRDMEARELFAIVADLNDVQKFRIDTANLRYANQIIRPGFIGQFLVPGYR
jgi:hypothetical protein